MNITMNFQTNYFIPKNMKLKRLYGITKSSSLNTIYEILKIYIGLIPSYTRELNHYNYYHYNYSYKYELYCDVRYKEDGIYNATKIPFNNLMIYSIDNASNVIYLYDL